MNEQYENQISNIENKIKIIFLMLDIILVIICIIFSFYLDTATQWGILFLGIFIYVMVKIYNQIKG